MVFPRIFLLAIPVCLYAQTKTVPLNVPAPPGGKQPTVTLSAEPASKPAAVPPDKVIIAVGDEKITAAEFERIVDALPEQYRNSVRTTGRRQFAESLVRVKLLAHEARTRKIDQTDAFKTQLAFQTENLLAGNVYQTIISTAQVPDSQSRQYYDQHKGEFERVRARHILVRMKGAPVPVRPDQKDLTEEEALAKAQQIRSKLVAGADFATLAKAESDDTGSAANGGDLGFFRHGQMVPPFEQAAFAMPVGQISEPVKSQFGYHIIKVEQKEAKPFEEVKADIEKRLRPEVAQKTLEEMRKAGNVTLDPTYFGEAPAAPAPTPAPAPVK